ncbi:MAG: TldD/PmbA family protein [Bacteroidales bacterium]|jgi:PmbA protein|nr:TldD/PmbA family protein [Bacteroidales bacterium]NLK80386.1 TldD/PmbA family protein [Bacteroidales bacterium]HKM31701.1 TldD/PmbA family protein [Bacteroidales bacterium]
MKEKDLLQETAAYALKSALKKGASAARVTAVRDESDGLTVLNNTLEQIQSAVESVLQIHVFADGRYGTCSTNKTEAADIDRLLDQTMASVRLLAPDPYRKLVPETIRYNGPPLQNAFTDEVSTRQKKELLFTCADAVYGKDPALINVSARFEDTRRWLHMKDSAGLDCTSDETWYSLSAECSVKGSDGTRPFDWDYIGGLSPAALGIGVTDNNHTIPQACAATALQRALAKRNPQKIKSGRYHVIVENRAASTLLAPVIDALSGPSLQQQNSFLLNKLEQRVGSSVLTLIDNPHKMELPGCSFFDTEGTATKKRTVIDQGILHVFYLNTYYSAKMNMPCTISSPSTLILTGGSGSMISLAGNMHNGLVITGFNGGNCNSATGDFSYGIEGFLVENGQITTPVNEMVMTGNMTELWNQLIMAGDDALTTSSWLIPSLLFEHVELAGL